MQKSKDNIIDDWLEQYGDPQIEQEVKQRLKYQILDHLEEEKHKLEEAKKEVLEKIRKVRQGNMLEEAAENIGVWYEYDREFFKIMEIDQKEVRALFSKMWDGRPAFEMSAVYEHEWRNAKRHDTIPEKLQKRIDKLNEMLK